MSMESWERKEHVKTMHVHNRRIDGQLGARKYR